MDKHHLTRPHQPEPHTSGRKGSRDDQRRRTRVADPSVTCGIHSLKERDISKWLVPGSPHGLTVLTPSCNLLVTCRRPTSKLLVLSADSGQCLREIKLQSVIKDPHHAVQLTTDQFVVSHGVAYDGLHQVFLGQLSLPPLRGR